MKVKAAIKKVKTYFAKQGIEIDVKNDGVRWCFEHNGYVASFWLTVLAPVRMRWTEKR